jgi:uncharacterized protein YggE
MNLKKGNSIKLFSLYFILFFGGINAHAQDAGNAIYSTNNNKHYQKHRNSNTSVQNGQSFLITAKISYHAIADSYVAIFGIVQESPTVKDCSALVETRINSFIKSMQGLGIAKKDILVDAITQNRVYEYQLDETTNIAKEVVKGFEIKKNIIVSYKDNKVLNQLMIAASKEEIHDLIKVDYLIEDSEKIDEQLYQEALKIIEKKKTVYLDLTDKKYLGSPQIIKFEKDIIYPLAAYQSYTAHESNSISVEGRRNNQTLKTVSARKITTRFFEAAPRVNFDKVINKHQFQPCVQFIMDLQLRFQTL